MVDPYQTPSNQTAPPQMPTQQQASLGDNAGVRMLIPVGRSGWAVTAGYLGIFSVVLLPAPLAIITSIIAMISIQKSKKSDKRKHGMGRAIFGLIMGLIFTPILAMLVLEQLEIMNF